MSFFKHLKLAALQQYLIIVAVNYCCTSLHISCLQGRGYTSAISVSERFCKEEECSSPESAVCRCCTK